MRRFRAPLRGQGVFFAAQFSAGYITNMPAFDLRQAQPFRAGFIQDTNSMTGVPAAPVHVRALPEFA
jgi:hypothetical protein